jgi:hypothetical protein
MRAHVSTVNIATTDL